MLFRSDKGLSGHGVGRGRLNVLIIVDRELRGLYGMMVTGLVFIRKRTQKGRLKTNETFAKKTFPQ